MKLFAELLKNPLHTGAPQSQFHGQLDHQGNISIIYII